MLSQKKGNEPDWDPEVEPLMKLLLGKKGIRTRSAAEVARKKVDYFRGRDFKKFVLSNGDLLKKKCPAALKVALNGTPPATDKEVERLGSELIQKQFCYKAMYKPINPSATDSEKKPKKWPDRLAKTPHQNFDCDGFYVIQYESGSGLQHFLLALIIVGVLLLCMFPVWPMWAKIGIWYLSVIFLSLYFGLLILRMVIYTVFWIVGFDFWIFPRLNDEDCGFLDSFQPVYSWEKRKDEMLMLLVRFGSLAIVAVAVEQISQTHSLSDVQDFVTSSYIDVLEWGVDKLALPGSDTKALPSLEQVSQMNIDDENNTDANASATVADVSPDGDEGDASPEGDTVDVDDKTETEEEVAS